MRRVVTTLIVIVGVALQPLGAVPSLGTESSAVRIGRGLAVNVSAIDGEQTEPFIAVAPKDASRIVVVAIDWTEDIWTPPYQGRNVFISSDRGRTWEVQHVGLVTDPTVIADNEGTFWVAGLGSYEDSTQSNGVEIRLARIEPRSHSIAAEMNLPRAPTALFQDRPMVAIDNSPNSPTHGRLYATWLASGSQGYLAVVLSYCDTRLGETYEPEHCDKTDNWTTPFPIAGGGAGLMLAPDVAAGPEGQVYLVWMSQLDGFISGASCSSECEGTEDFTPSVIAKTGHPLGCFRTGETTSQNYCTPTPRIDVDISSGPNSGRVYVSWMDVAEAGSGSMDGYVASKDNTLPGGPLPSEQVGTLIYTDGEADLEGSQGSSRSDEFFPNVAVDESSGIVWISFYSTRLDADGKSTNVYVRRLQLKGETSSLSRLRRVSNELDLSEGDKDIYYGDYTGLDVVGGWPFAVWVGKDGDKDVFTYVRAKK